MNLLEHTKSIVLDPNELNLEDPTYYIPCYANLKELMESIERVGLINAPLVQEIGSDNVVPVLGRRRMAAARAIGLTKVESRILPANISVSDGFILAFWDNIAHRHLDLSSKAVLIKRFFELFPSDVVVNTFLPALCVPPNGPLLERLQAIGGLEHSVLEAVASGRIYDKSAHKLSRLNASDRTVCMDLIAELRMNANNADEFISNLVDLSVLSKKPIHEIMASADAVSILQNDELPVMQKSQACRKLVRLWKFPEIVKNEKDFSKWYKALSLPKEVTVRPTQSFEDPGCTIEVHVRSRDDARRILNRLCGTL